MEKELKQNEDFLRKLVGESTGFSVPESYLVEIEDQLLMTSKETSFSKTEGFGVPDSYFDSVEDSVLTRLQSESKGKIISLRKQTIRWIPVAAAAIIVLFLTFNLINFTDHNVTQDDIVEWFEEDIELLNNEDLLMAFEEIDLNTSSPLTDSVTETEIEQYLYNSDLTALLDEIN